MLFLRLDLLASLDANLVISTSREISSSCFGYHGRWRRRGIEVLGFWRVCIMYPHVESTGSAICAAQVFP